MSYHRNGKQIKRMQQKIISKVSLQQGQQMQDGIRGIEQVEPP